MTTFNTTDLCNDTSRKTEAAPLSEMELDAVTGGAGGPTNPNGGAGGMINPQPLPPQHGGSRDPRQF
jgi:hypothetical protein